MKILVTGAGGLIGSEAVRFYGDLHCEIIGVDNNMRRTFFGVQGDVTWNIRRLKETVRYFKHVDLDIRDQAELKMLFQQHRFDRIIHCAAQPSHDKAKDFPLLDFEVNALGTINLLEMTRLFSPEAVFIHLSTNKVYGETPNEFPLVELATRWDYANASDHDGVSEECRIDRTTHSLFGASKTAGDVVAQEYGRYFGMKVGVFRGGCLTGPSHSGVELHGFLSYLVKTAVQKKPYTVFGYKGKQVRDNIHSHDVIRAFEAFANNPRPGEVYNLGGGRENSISVIEAIDMIGHVSGAPISWTYNETHRTGDHICYISNLKKFRSHYPEWAVNFKLHQIIEEMVEAERRRSI